MAKYLDGVEQARKRQGRQAWGAAALTWIGFVGLAALVVVVVRVNLGGQVALNGVDGISTEDAATFQQVEWFWSSVFGLVVALIVRACVESGLSSVYAMSWWKAVFLPVLAGLVFYTAAYYASYEAALRSYG